MSTYKYTHSNSDTETLSLRTDLLPDDDVLKLSLEHKQTTLPIEKQKELTSAVLDLVKSDKHDAEQILKRKYPTYPYTELEITCLI